MTAPPFVDRFGRYVVLAELGAGAFGTVYRARDQNLSREVALKVLRQGIILDDIEQRRFLEEARALALLRHQNVVNIYDMGQHDGRPYIAMELVDGQPLSQVLRAAGKLSVLYVSDILEQLCSAIEFMHRSGFVHRDIKPANVMQAANGSIKLMDFGIARSLDRTRLTKIGTWLGTPEYAAPEQWRGELVGPAADIYALGVLTYELLAGRPPFVGDMTHLMYAQAHLSPPPLSDLVPYIDRAIGKAVGAALEKDPRKRPATAIRFYEMFSSGRSSARAQRTQSARRDFDGNARATAANPTRPSQETAWHIRAGYIPGGRQVGVASGTLSLFKSSLEFTPVWYSLPRRRLFLPLSEIAYFDVERRRLRRAVAVCTRTGQSHYFYPVGIGADQMLQALRRMF